MTPWSLSAFRQEKGGKGTGFRACAGTDQKSAKSGKGFAERNQRADFSESLEEMTEHLRQAGKPVGVLVDLTLRFMERYREKKKEKNVLDFADLSIMPWRFW